ncbi:MAG: glucose-1-phosphate thymidylyltransferase [Bacilli bacterium]|nr:glucose-1-phosphate thymidylyltransferase [Bacilli bacterium]
MKGIIFAGGNGTRLYPSTSVYSKQLINLYDKPAIYYPLATLMKSGITDILVITTKENCNLFKKLLLDGKQLGIKIEYKIQKKPNGCAAGLKLCKSFVKKEPFCVIMGDNLIYGNEVVSEIRKISNDFSGAKIFCYKVRNPKDYGVINIKDGKIIKIEEKPKNPTSDLAIMGIYIYDKNVFKCIKNISISERNELEIPDINKLYLKNKTLKYKIISNKEKWIDIGTPENLLFASSFIYNTQKKNKTIVACIEEIAYHNKYISINQLKKLGKNNCEYGEYILSIKEDK